jgi:hypothetical protein
MQAIFTWCAIIGGSIFALQFLMLLLGLHGGHDLDFGSHDLEMPHLDVPHLEVPTADADVDVPGVEGAEGVSGGSLAHAPHENAQHPGTSAHSDGWFVGIVTIRSLVAAVAVFGLTGLGAMKHLPPVKAFAAASLAGLGMLYLVGWMFKQLYQLQADGTVQMQDTIGCTGTVYLNIPGQLQGAGKVTVKVAERTMEYPAMTAGESLKTGTPVVVTNVISEDTLEVESQLPVDAVTSGSQENS